MALEHLSDVVQRCVSTSGHTRRICKLPTPHLTAETDLICKSHSFCTQQTLPVDGYTSEDYDVFTVSGRTCIEEGNIAQVLSLVLDEKNQVQSIQVLSGMHWMKSPRVCRHVGNHKMYGLDSAAAADPGPPEERGQKLAPVLGHF